MRVLWIAALMAMVALAGCAGNDAENINDGMDDSESTQDNTGDDAGAPVVPDLNDPVTQDWFFTASDGLQNTTPPEGTVAMAGGFSTFATGATFPSFQSEAVDVPTLILPDAIEVDLYYTSSAPGVYNAGFSYAVWAGSTQSMPLVQIGQVTGPVVPDEVNHLQMTLDWGTRLPVLVEPGESIQLIIAINVDGASDAGAVSLLVGGDDTASKAVITTQTMNVNPLETETTPTAETFSGTLTASEPISCDVQEDVSHTFHAVVVGDNVTFLRAESSGSDQSGSGDLDIDLYDGTSVLGGGHTPTADEGILWGGPDFEELRGKTLTLRVTICLATQMDYDVVVTQG